MCTLYLWTKPLQQWTDQQQHLGWAEFGVEGPEKFIRIGRNLRSLCLSLERTALPLAPEREWRERGPTFRSEQHTTTTHRIFNHGGDWRKKKPPPLSATDQVLADPTPLANWPRAYMVDLQPRRKKSNGMRKRSISFWSASMKCFSQPRWMDRSWAARNLFPNLSTKSSTSTSLNHLLI